jgi:hypothetical protein
MEPTDKPIDEIRAEKFEIDTLLERGLSFTIPKRSLFKRFGKPERTFIIQQPFLGTLDRLSEQFIQMDFSEEFLQQAGMPEAKRILAINTRRCATVVAIAVLNSQWKIKLLTPFLASYLLWRVTPHKLAQLALMITQISNLGDFINSIRLLSVNLTRTTAPARMEKPPVKESQPA